MLLTPLEATSPRSAAWDCGRFVTPLGAAVEIVSENGKSRPKPTQDDPTDVTPGPTDLELISPLAASPQRPFFGTSPDGQTRNARHGDDPGLQSDHHRSIGTRHGPGTARRALVRGLSHAIDTRLTSFNTTIGLAPRPSSKD